MLCGGLETKDQTSPAISIRRARRSDRAFVLDTARRLADFDLPAWRGAAEIIAGETRTLESFFRSPSPDSELLVAQADEAALGFVFLETGRDYFSREEHGHIGILAVARASEGLGVGRVLIAAAEAWTKRRGLAKLTLNVFDRNDRARRLYERLGYRAETLRYMKAL
jgi:GNAT superfamily N-acetyltransferase